jgi:hypothetical protein
VRRTTKQKPGPQFSDHRDDKAWAALNYYVDDAAAPGKGDDA